MPLDPMMAKLDPNESIRQAFGLGDADEVTIPQRQEVAEVKTLPFYPQDAAAFWGGSRTLIQYRSDVGQGLDSNVVMAPVMWIMRTFTEAIARVQSRTPEGVWRWAEDHDLEDTIEKPNDFYNGDALWKGTSLSYVMDGNAYWRKIRNSIGDVLGYWYLPHWLVTPQRPPGLSTIFTSHYRYTPVAGGVPENIPVRDIVHFRFGLDPEDPRRGLAPLKCLLREVYTDDEAQNFSAKILQKMGVPGLLVSPATDGPPISAEALEKAKAYMRTAFSGENRGAPLVTDRPTKVDQFGFNPEQIALGSLRDMSEERVCAVLGLPAAVVGFGSGMQSTKVGATMRELRRLAWVQCLTPMQKSMAKDLTAQLLPDFQDQRRRFRVRFDTSDVAAYQEDYDALWARLNIGVQGGWLRIDRAQELAGLEVDPKQKFYLRPSNSIPIDENGEPVQEAKPPGAVDQRGNEGAQPEDLATAVANRRNGRNGAKPEDGGGT
jgi:HK97 family phage portal protein